MMVTWHVKLLIALAAMPAVVCLFWEAPFAADPSYPSPLSTDVTEPITNTALQAYAEHSAAGERKLLINLQNTNVAGARQDRIHKGCPLHIMVFWPKLPRSSVDQILEELRSQTPGLAVLKALRLPFPPGQKEFAACHAKFYGRNAGSHHPNSVTPKASVPKLVIGEKGLGPLLAIVVSIDCTMARWQDAPGTEGTHDAAMGQFKVALRNKYKTSYALHASDDEHEAKVDIRSFFGINAYNTISSFRDGGGTWDGTTIEQGPEGCPVPGKAPRVRTAKEMKENKKRKNSLQKKFAKAQAKAGK